MNEGLEALVKMEGVDVRVLSYFLTDNAKYLFQAQMFPGTGTRAIETSWTYILNELIGWLLNEEEMQ